MNMSYWAEAEYFYDILLPRVFEFQIYLRVHKIILYV